MKRLHRPIVLAIVALVPALAAAQAPAKIGILLLAHGGQPQWNAAVNDLVKRVDAEQPTEVAFGMATRANIKGALDRLVARGATRIVAVPLFISSHSSVITSTEYLLGQRGSAPPDLAKFAKMNHGANGAPAGDHAAHPEDPASPIASPVPVSMTPALNRHPLVGAILADRAQSISTAPSTEAVILVAHGPVPDDDNQKWLADMAGLAGHVRKAAPFAAVEYMTVRDDAGPAIRDAATIALREKVQAHRAAGRRVLIVPHLMSFGGIEKGLLKRLEGLEYAITSQALMPDDRLVAWVLASAMQVAGITESVVVIGQMVDSEALLRRTPGSYDLLSRADLERSHVFTSSEALRKIPGVTVRDEEGIGLRPNIGFRGLNPTRSNKILLLEDGLPVTYAPYGDNASYYHPPIERFDRIEVLKGSSQIAYGPVTLGGVVNYITPEAPSRTSWSLDVTAGNRDYVNGGVSGGGRWKNAGFFGHVVRKQSDGSRENIEARLTDILGKATWTLSGTQHLGIKANYYGEDSQVTYSGLREAEYLANPRQNPFANDHFAGRRSGASVTYQAVLWSRVAATVQAYGSTFSRDWWRQSSNSAQRPNDSGDPLCGGMANLSSTCGNEGRLRDYLHGGVEARGRMMFGGAILHETDFGARVHLEDQDRLQKNGATPTARDGAVVENNGRTTDALSAFVQHRVMAGKWTMTPGVRVEQIEHSRTNRLIGVTGTTALTEAVPGFGVSYAPSPDVTLFGGVHRGFAPPRAEDIISNTTGGSIDLDPERSWNYEAGVRARRSHLQASLTAFRLDYSNQIVPASVAGGVGATLTNGGETLHQGLEAGAEAEWRAVRGSRHGAYAGAAITWLPVARFEGVRTSGVSGFTTTSVSRNRLPYAPEFSQTITLGYRHAGGVDVQVESQHVGAQFGDDLNTISPTADGQRGRLDAYTYVNLTASAPLARMPGRLFVAVKNLTDRTFIIDRVRGILPGHPRLIHIGTSWRF